jgi:hypothetical protein
MLDFRYHALSLVAVFLALAVGLLLGIAVGDAGLVSSARENIESSLRGDVRASRAEAADLRGELERRQNYEKQIYPDLVAGLLFLGGADDAVVDEVRSAIEPAGAQLRWVSVLREPPDVPTLADRASGTRYESLVTDGELLKPYAERIGVQLVTTGRLVTQSRPALMRSFSGDLGLVDAVVVVRAEQRPEESDDQAGATATLEDGIVRGIARTDAPIVGVEELDTDPSQVGWYRDRGLASVDSVDEVSGRAALVFALAGADGAYGLKSSAEALLPRVVGGVRRP